MKSRSIFLLSIFILATASVFAENQIAPAPAPTPEVPKANMIYNTTKSTGAGNKIIVYNDADSDIAYVMMGTMSGAVYGLKRGANGVYVTGSNRFGGTDAFTEIEVGVCSQLNENGTCDAPGKMPACIAGHYNADLIKEIRVTSLTSCVVTCTDGTSTSCKQSG